MSGKTMDWNQIRRQWRRDSSAITAMSLAEIQAQDRVLHKQIRARDRRETVVAIVVVLFFGYVAWSEAGRHAWMGATFAAELVLWALWVPFRLRKARRDAPEPRHDLPLRSYLVRQRDMLLAQARMLERAWLWYVMPCMVGVIGLTLSHADGVWTVKNDMVGMTIRLVFFSYIAGVIALGVGVAWLNRYVARTKLRTRVEQLDRHLESLSPEDAK
jgi:hypothetical protein